MRTTERYRLTYKYGGIPLFIDNLGEYDDISLGADSIDGSYPMSNLQVLLLLNQNEGLKRENERLLNIIYDSKDIHHAQEKAENRELKSETYYIHLDHENIRKEATNYLKHAKEEGFAFGKGYVELQAYQQLIATIAQIEHNNQVRRKTEEG